MFVMMASLQNVLLLLVTIPKVAMGVHAIKVCRLKKNEAFLITYLSK